MEQSWMRATLLIRDSNTGVFLWIFQKFYGQLFLERFRWLLFNKVLVSEKNFKKRKLVERLPLLWLTCFKHKYKSLQTGELPGEHLSFLQNLLNFIITKYLKQEVDDDLNFCVDERSPCGLAITGDIKIYECHVIKR